MARSPAAAFTSGAPVEDRSGNRQPGLQPAAYIQQVDFTTASLDLNAREALFIVVRDTPQALPASTISSATRTLATLNGPWTVTFPAHLGAPASAQLSKLTSWTESPDPGIKFFSGTATYSTTLTASAAMLRRKPSAGTRLVLHL